jgi:AcrR family transcriptional regulator
VPTETFENLPAEKRERFIDAALEEFASNSYRNASISRIADRAGIAKGSVYQYFLDKKDLYLYLIDLGGKVKLDFIQSKQAEVNWSDFYRGFKSYLLLGAQFEFSGPRELRFASLLRRALASDMWDESFSKMKASSQAAIAGLVARAREQGQVRDDIPVDMAVFYINSLVTGIADYVASALGVGLVELADRLLQRTQASQLGSQASPAPVQSSEPAQDSTDSPARLDVLGLDFARVIDDLMALMRGGLEPRGNPRQEDIKGDTGA